MEVSDVYYVRGIAWLFLGMGVALGSVGILALAGLLKASIDFFGIDLDTGRERITWVAAREAGIDIR